MVIYVDKDHKCHIFNDGTMDPVEEDFFDEKCQTFIEGYCYDDSSEHIQIYPWKPDHELDDAQREYEREKLEDAENALSILLGGEV